MSEADFEIAKTKILEKLKGLDPRLTYHNVEHTLDVLNQCLRIADEEGVFNQRELLLLKYAALYHDIGFLEKYSGHEEKGCEYFLEDSRAWNFSDGDKETIIDLIMATKLPQAPRTKLQRIICDADLDYLGRNDFPDVSECLRKEFIEYKFVADDKEWNERQKRFLKSHTYHTPSSRLVREPVKQRNYSKLQ
jgi:uncharacterized protein